MKDKSPKYEKLMHIQKRNVPISYASRLQNLSDIELLASLEEQKKYTGHTEAFLGGCSLFPYSLFFGLVAYAGKRSSGYALLTLAAIGLAGLLYGSIGAAFLEDRHKKKLSALEKEVQSRDLMK